MTGLDIFALVVLFVMGAAAVAAWVTLGMLPGRIARSRNHPQADAINMCGWWGALTMGLLTPIAFIWAYTRSGKEAEPRRDEPPSTDQKAEMS
jgi:hypothetical protein